MHKEISDRQTHITKMVGSMFVRLGQVMPQQEAGADCRFLRRSSCARCITRLFVNKHGLFVTVKALLHHLLLDFDRTKLLIFEIKACLSCWLQATNLFSMHH